MRKSLVTSFILGVLMIVSAALTMALTPTKKIADQQEKFD